MQELARKAAFLVQETSFLAIVLLPFTTREEGTV